MMNRQHLMTYLSNEWQKHAMKIHFIEISGQKSDELEYNIDLIKKIEKEWFSPIDSKGLNRGLNQHPDQGMLSFLGYHVGGKNAPNDYKRPAIIKGVFRARFLPLIGSAEYLSQWGSAQSKERLRKLTWCLEGFIRNAEPQRRDMRNSIARWDTDLRFLKETFEADRFVSRPAHRNAGRTNEIAEHFAHL
jgi:hypothetical protein